MPRPDTGQRGGHGILQTRPAPSVEMLSAPYRFVTLDDHVVLAQTETTKACWGFPIPGGFSGEIAVEWAFETPMLIGVEKDHVSGPMKLGEKYVIPVATLRGAMRAAMGIVCRARLTQVNINHRYGVRDFTHPLFKEGEGEGAQRLAWDRLGAGWLQKKKASEEEKAQDLSEYVLTPCDKKIVRIRALPASFNRGNPTDTGEWHRDWLGTKLGERYASAGYVKERIGAKKFIFDFEQSPQTFFAPAPTAEPEDPTSGDHVIPGGAGGRKGWFVFSANSPALRNVDPRTLARTLDEQQRSPKKGDQKKREYAFFDRREPKNIRLKQEAFDRFERMNSKPGKTKLKPDGSYAVMEPTLKKGLRIPVFYVGDPEGDSAGFDMGLTRLFKLSHVNGVGAVLARQEHHKHSRGEPDMIEALFGHVYDRADLGIGNDERLAPGETGRKGRISFGFAELSEKTPARETDVITTTAMAPRASFAPFYLRGPIKDWTDEARNGNSGEARLAGRKRYFARFPAPRLASAEADIVAALSGLNNTTSPDTQSRLRLLKPAAPNGELVFSGIIRLHNVTAEEIGALLWTLTHGGEARKPYRHMIGRAKNVGAGQARVKSLRMKLTAHAGKASKENLLTTAPETWESTGADGGWTAADGQSLGPFLREFEKYMRKQDASWPQVNDILEFLGASDPDAGQKLRAAYLPTPNDFGKLRRLVKADTQKDPAPVTKESNRLLPAPKASKVITPYTAV